MSKIERLPGHYMDFNHKIVDELDDEDLIEMQLIEKRIKQKNKQKKENLLGKQYKETLDKIQEDFKVVG